MRLMITYPAQRTVLRSVQGMILLITGKEEVTKQIFCDLLSLFSSPLN